MKRIGWLILILAGLTLCISACSRAGGFGIKEPWSRPANAGDNGAAFFVISNQENASLVLRSASGTIAEKIELHKSSMENGVMKMEPQAFVEVPAKQSVEFKPGSYHVMLINLKQDLKPGDTFDLTLQFDGSEAKTIQVTVKQP